MDGGLVEFVKVEGLAYHSPQDRQAKARGIARLFAAGWLALEGGRMPARLPPVR